MPTAKRLQWNVALGVIAAGLVIAGVVVGVGSSLSDNGAVIALLPVVLAVLSSLALFLRPWGGRLLSMILSSILFLFSVLSILSIGVLILPGAILLLVASFAGAKRDNADLLAPHA